MRAGSWEAHPSEGERKREMPCGDDDEGALAPCGACMGGGALGRGNMAMGDGASLQGACCGWGLEEVYMGEWEGEIKEGRSVDGVAVDVARRGACTGRGVFASWKKPTSDGCSMQGSCCGWYGWLEMEMEVEVEKGIWWGDAGDDGKGE